MAWLPSYQELRDHPKTRKAVVLLGVPRAQVIGHLHCLWWWALTYAPDGDLARYDVTDIALAAEWDGDPDKFVDALASCGAGGGPGFVERASDGVTLHDWAEYGGKYVEKRRREADRLRTHRQSSDGRTEHVRSTQAVPTTNVGGKSREEKSREEKDRAETAARSARKTSQPVGWAPNDTHQKLAGEQGVDLDREAQQFSDFHASKGSRFVDWDRAFCTWLRNASQYSGPRHLRPAAGVDGDDSFHRVRLTR